MNEEDEQPKVPIWIYMDTEMSIDSAANTHWFKKPPETASTNSYISVRDYATLYPKEMSLFDTELLKKPKKKKNSRSKKKERNDRLSQLLEIRPIDDEDEKRMQANKGVLHEMD